MENNLGKINSIFIQNIPKILKTKDGAKLIKEYVNTIKKNKSLLKEYIVYDLIENITNKEMSSLIVSEAINQMAGVDKKELEKEHKKLEKFLSENKLKEVTPIENSELFESIHKLIFTKNTLKNINEKVENVKNICNLIESKKSPETTINESKVELDDMFIKMLVKNFNLKYYDRLTEDQKQLFKSITNKKSEGEMGELFEDYRKQCLSLTNDFLKEAIDNTTREKLLNVKETLLEQKFKPETYVEDILSFNDLRETLTEENE